MSGQSVLALFICRVEQFRVPGQRHDDGAAVEQINRNSLIRELIVLHAFARFDFESRIPFLQQPSLVFIEQTLNPSQFGQARGVSLPT